MLLEFKNSTFWVGDDENWLQVKKMYPRNTYPLLIHVVCYHSTRTVNWSINMSNWNIIELLIKFHIALHPWFFYNDIM